MSSRIARCFERCRTAEQTALVTYITAGDPDRGATIGYMQSLIAGGADIIELGVPFSDPMADGPVIQRASERALAGGTTLHDVIDIVSEFRQRDEQTPVVLMGYLNPVEAMGYTEFADAAAKAGVDGVLVVDLPPEEARELNAILSERGLDQIFLVSPNSSVCRVGEVAELGSGFVYYVTVKGVTGSSKLDPADVAERIQGFRKDVAMPVGVGFGIKTPDDAAAMAPISDAVIVGSALVEIIEQSQHDVTQTRRILQQTVADLRSAMQRADAGGV